MEEGSGRGLDRVGSNFLSAIAGRVGSGRVNVSSGWVGSKKSDPRTTLLTLGLFDNHCSEFAFKNR